MSEAAAHLQERLLLGYRAQLGHYDRAAGILEQHAEDADTAWAQVLHDVLMKAASLNQNMAVDVATWREMGQHAGPQLRDVLERLGRRIQALQRAIDEKVETFRAHKDRLVPEIDEFLHKRRMLQAYNRTK